MSEPTVEVFTKEERIDAARSEVRRAVAGDCVIAIHPFDMFTLLINPTVFDVVLINMFDRQFIVIDGSVYEQTNTVKNKTKLGDIIALGKKNEPTS